jgi:hypothetical protein
MAESVESLGDRAGWKVDGEVATYCPEPGGWSARVRVSQNSKYYARWMVAIIDPHGKARYVTHASMLGEAAQVAEGRVHGAGLRT